MISIEKYTEVHKREVANLILNIQRNEFDIPITLKDQPDLKDIPSFYQINNGNFWIARADDILVGTIAVLDIGNKQAALRKMFVKAAYRGSNYGIGQKLLNTVFVWSKNNGIDEIFLGTTEKFIAAQRFYEKNGFREIDKELLPKAFPVMEVDIKFYKHSTPFVP